MKLLEKILVPTDFSPGAEDALQVALLVAKQFQSEITLLHVVPGSSHRYSGAAGMIKTSVEEELHDAERRVREQGVQTVHTVVDFGVPFYQINQQADQAEVNLIIMGARQEAGDGPCALGTTAAGVRRIASKPVWNVKPGTMPAIRRILSPVNFTDASGRALQNAIHLSRGFEAELTVLRVTAGPSSSSKSTEKRVAESKEAGARREQELLASFIQEFDFHNVRSKSLIRQGKPHEEILKVAEETDSDLLVLGSVGRSRLTRMLVGGVGRKIARQMPCSMVTVRSEHAIRLRLDPESADLEAHFQLGHELLALGFPEEAGAQFRYCIAKDNLHAPAWEGLAVAHQRMGQDEEAKRFEEHAEHVVETLYHRHIEADIRSKHPLFRPLFGMK
jgi:nucleotide-binding universal stress UspA family protein